MADSRWKKCSLSWAQGHPGKCPLLDWPAESNCSFEAGPGVIDNLGPLPSSLPWRGRHIRHRHAKFFCSLDGELAISVSLLFKPGFHCWGASQTPSLKYLFAIVSSNAVLRLLINEMIE